MALINTNTGVEAHTHPLNQITGEIVANYDPSPGNRPRLMWANVGTNTNSPNDGTGWIVLDLPWADQNFSYNLQFATKYNNNPQGVWWRPTLNQPGSPWYRLVDEKIVSWTPILASDNNINWQYISRNAYYIQYASLVMIYCNLIAQPASGQPMPTGAVRISGFPLTPTGVFTNTCRASGGGAVKYAHRVNLFTNSLITFTKNFVSGTDIGEANYSWTDTNTGYFTTEFNLIARV